LPVPLREQWASISLEQKLAMFVAPVVVFCCTTALIPGVRDLFRDGSTSKTTVTPPTTTTIGAPCPATGGPSPAAGSASGLEVVDLTPCDSRIEISMRNIGRLVSVIRRAEFRVRAMETIDTHCRGNSAALPISQTYDKDPRLYQLDVLIFHDRETEPINAGTAILAVATPGRISFEPSNDADANEQACVRGPCTCGRRSEGTDEPSVVRQPPTGGRHRSR
jgi:hypothetical protein